MKTIALALNPMKLIPAFYRRQKAKAHENRRRAALFKMREAFDHYDISFDELTDTELEALIRHTGELAGEIVTRKSIALRGVIASSSEAINK